MKKRLLSLLMALIMALSLVPVTAFAADDHDGQVHVTVENTTWTKADGAPWEGTLVDEWVTLKDDSTMMSCIVDALAAKGYTQTGADTGYISEINGIKEKDASKDSGWMGTLNDWFTSEGFAKYTVANGKLKSGDEIAVQHTCNLGADIGGIPELIDAGENGELFESGNADALAGKIRALWGDRARLDAYTKACGKTRFDTVEAYAEKLMRLYQG